ncbi:Letm1 RBD domain-containing protein [Favolaschia claudopus]|uniref:Letm1 RBD domain-containing protein n=1 Tax=Favolaschia claudopus TaxID=2862362 RepID=A0AAW0DYG9_9AGAR
MIRSRALSARLYHRAHRIPVVYPVYRLHTQPTKPSNNSPPPPTNNPQKPHLKLSPSPVKTPKSLPPSPQQPATPSRASPPTVQSVDRVSFSDLKETTAKDIADAESHGILAPPPPGAGWAKSTMHKAIQMAKFYYRGVKLVYTRGKMSRAIRRRVAAGGAPLERWEHRMIHTQSGDEKKLIPFVIIAIILEEVIPLIAIWFPQMLPSTCVLPSQRDRILQGLTDKALAVPTTWGSTLASLTRAAADTGEISLDALNENKLIRPVAGLLLLPGLGLTAKRRLRKHLTFIQTDDRFLLEEDIGSLTTSDLVQALRERGISQPGVNHHEQVKQLSGWLKSVDKNDSITRRIYLVALRASR